MRPRVLLATGVLVAALAAPATAAPASELIVLPGATSAEGIAVGRGATFFAGDLFKGDIYRGDLQRGTAELFISAPAGRMAAGLKFDDATQLLFVAGGFTGQAYLYDGVTGAEVATYQFGGLINDVVVARGGAWFTDSVQPKLYFVPVSETGVPGPARVLNLSGPAADITGDFNLNGIEVTPDGKTLLVAHSANAAVYTVDPVSGASADVGIEVPFVDGIVLEGSHLWVVQNFINQVTRWQLSPDLTAGSLEKTITSPQFHVPTTAALHGNQLAVVNGKFDTGFPPTADQYEVVLVGK